jgi:hypothetical protein
MSKLTDLINENVNASQHIKNLYEEYALHESAEAKYVKSLGMYPFYLK